MSLPDTNLLSIIRLLNQNKRIIIGITIIAAISGLLTNLLRKKTYTAGTEFFLKNPLYTDRNYLYNNETKFIDYFANEEDMNHLMTFSRSDSFQYSIIRQMKLDSVYKTDFNDDEDRFLLRKQFGANLEIRRTDQKSLTLSFTDDNAKRAADVANLSLQQLEQNLRNYYLQIRRHMYASIANKVTEQDSLIDLFTDSLVVLRDRYGIYDIISPARYNLMLTSMKPNGQPGFARGLEEIQNIESLKDELVSNRARHLSLIRQYRTGDSLDNLPLVFVIRTAEPPVRANGPGKIMSGLMGGFAGFLFSVIGVLMMNVYNAGKRH